MSKGHWPAGCHSPNSCARNKRCMYINCPYERESIEDMIRYREYVAEVNRMNDKGEIKQKR